MYLGKFCSPKDPTWMAGKETVGNEETEMGKRGGIGKTEFFGY
jgi:hypothetical protein